MAQRTVLVDDLTGEEDSEKTPVMTWRFGLGPRNNFKTYDIDLNEKNYARLEKALAEFIAVAAEVQGSAPTSSGPRRSRGAVTGPNKPITKGGKTAKEVREVLRAEGYDVKDGGRLSNEQKEKYTYHTKDEFL